MALLDSLFKISAICSAFGVEEAVIAPGSRSAALTLAFARNPKINTTVISDERSAGFVALGMAQVSRKPVVVICTSGTAALNLAPAVAEACFQKIKLLVLTADRPPEWIHQYDGQTIFQTGIFGPHVLKSYDFPVDYTHPDARWQIERDTCEALAFSQRGPVHINIPIREPFYPDAGEQFDGEFRKVSYLEGRKSLSETDWQELMKTWFQARDIVIAVGQNQDNLDESLKVLSLLPGVSIWSDVISNIHIENRITTHDLFLNLTEGKKVGLLITLGKSFISKPFKQYFRKNKPRIHWQIGEDAEMIDPLQSISQKILVSDDYFLQELAVRGAGREWEENENFWQNRNQDSKAKLGDFLKNCAFGELKATYHILGNLTPGDALHLGNSMPVRYGNYLNTFLPMGVTVYANRGTSGIDGVVSTAVGQSVKTAGRVHCVVGDISFFYDSNAMFARKADNLSIYLMNNGGGNIFRMIDGPGRQPELESHFLTNTGRNARNLAADAGFEYHAIYDEGELLKALSSTPSRATLYEIFLDGKKDFELLNQLKEAMTFMG